MAAANGNRPAPADEHAEECLLGAALLTDDAAQIVAADLLPEDFYRPAHQTIAAAITELVALGSHVDTALVLAQLKPKQRDQIGGQAALISLQVNTPSTSHARSYAQRILQAKHRRQVIGIAGEVIDAAYQGDPSPKLAELSSVAVDGPHLEFVRTPLGPLIRDGVPAPTMVHPWLYAGGLHSLQSEPAVGKTLLALWLCLQSINNGLSVIYMDEEGGEELVAERLAAMGADPEVVDRLFFYFPFPNRRWTPADIAGLRATITEAGTAGTLAMGVFDSLPDFLAAAALNEDSSMDVTTFAQRLLAPFRDVGAALVVLDHMAKPAETSPSKKRGPSRYGRGSSAKLAKTHATLLIETGEPFDRTHSGKLHLWATKDRRGFLDLPHTKDPPMVLDVIVGDGTVRFQVGETSKEDLESWSGPTRCMDDVLGALTPGEWLSGGQIEKIMGYRRETVREALRSLSEQKVLLRRAGRRGAVEYSLADGALEEQQQF